MANDLFYIASVKHTRKAEKAITFWRAENAGYCYGVAVAGVYTRKEVEGDLEYYNSGDSTVAVPHELVLKLAHMGEVDGQPAMIVANSVENWKKFIAGCVFELGGPVRCAVFSKKDLQG